MTPESLIQSLERLGKVDAALLEKIRKQVADPSKRVSAKAIVKLLIDRKQISKADARELLGQSAGKSKPTRTRHEEIEVSQPESRTEDSDQLLAGARDDGADAEEQAAEVEAIEEIEEIEEVVEAVEEAAVTRVELEPAPEVYEVSPDEVQQLETRMDDGDYRGLTEQKLPDQLNYDPFADPASSGATPVASSGEHTAYAFQGKREAKPRWSSRWLIVGPGVLGFLLLVGIPLTFWLLRTPAEQMWNQANEAFAEGDYGQAIEQYDKFINEYPNDERHNLARVRKVESLLAQSFTAKQWDETYLRALEKLPEIESLEEFREIRDSLSDILPKTALGFTEKALATAEIEGKASLLKQADDAMQLVETPAYIPSSFRQKPAVEDTIRNVTDNRREIRYVLEMEQKYIDSLAQINQLVEEGKTDKAMQVFQSLTSKYKSLLARQPLVDAIGNAAEKERQNVGAGELNTQPVAPRSDSVIRKTLLLARQEGGSAAGLESRVLSMLVDGAVYGVRAVDGHVLWRRHVGLETGIEPLQLGADAVVLSDESRDTLEAVDRQTGERRWAVGIGEPFFAPATDGRDLFVTTASGKIARIDGGTGAVAAVAQLPQSATVSCCVADGYVYQPGEYSNFYVLSASDLSCTSTNFVGTDHIAGSVTIPPRVVAGYLLLVINRGDYSNLHAYEVVGDGTLVAAQFMERFTEGEVNTPMYTFERWTILASDTGDLKMAGVNRTDKDRPIDVSAEYDFAVDDSALRRQLVGMRHYLYADNGSLWIGNKGITKYRIIKSRNVFERRLPSFGNDIFLGPIEGEGEFLLTVRRRQGSRMASLAALSVSDHSEVWRTDLAAPLAGAGIRAGNETFVVSSQGDKFEVDADLLANGFSGRPVTQGSTILQDLLFVGRLALANGREVYYGPADRRTILNYRGQDSQLVDFVEPADAPSCPPIAMGDSLVVASVTGHVSLVNPQTGQIEGTPFLPEVQPDSRIRWTRPCRISEDQLVIADQDSGDFYRLRVTAAGLELESQSEYGSPIDSPLGFAGGMVVAVGAGKDGGSRLLSFDPQDLSLQTQASVDLPAGLVEGPYLVGNAGWVLKLADNTLRYFDAQQLSGGDTAQAWSVGQIESTLAGEPVMLGQSLVVPLASGRVLRIDVANGQVDELDLQQPLAGSPWEMDGSWAFPTLDGHVHLVDAPQ